MSITRIGAGARMSQAVVHGNTVYLAGVVADNPVPSVAKQTSQILKSIDKLLKHAGTSKAKILKANIWLSDIRTFDEMNKVWDAWMPQGCTPGYVVLICSMTRCKGVLAPFGICTDDELALSERCGRLPCRVSNMCMCGQGRQRHFSQHYTAAASIMWNGAGSGMQRNSSKPAAPSNSLNSAAVRSRPPFCTIMLRSDSIASGAQASSSNARSTMSSVAWWFIDRRIVFKIFETCSSFQSWRTRDRI